MGTLQLLRAVGHGIALGALIVGLAAAHLCAQPAAPMVGPPMVRTPSPVTYVTPDVERILAERYRETQRDSLSLEYGACLEYETIPLSAEARLYRITAVRFPPQAADILRGADGRIVKYRLFAFCEPDEIHLHTHSRHQCTGILGAECIDYPDLWRRPSTNDSASVRNHALALIQYREREYVEYFPDSIPASVLATVDAQRPAAPAPELELPIPSAAVLIGSLLSGYAVGWIDRDPGGYLDSFRGHDKLAHAATCAALYAAVRSLGAPRWLAAAAPMLAGVALEVGQSRDGGYGSPYDVVATSAGCGVALVVDAQVRRIRQR